MTRVWHATVIPLIGIGFNDYTGIEEWSVGGFVFGGIIGMEGMGLVNGKNERFANASRVQIESDCPSMMLQGGTIIR